MNIFVMKVAGFANMSSDQLTDNGVREESARDRALQLGGELGSVQSAAQRTISRLQDLIGKVNTEAAEDRRAIAVLAAEERKIAERTAATLAKDVEKAATDAAKEARRLGHTTNQVLNASYAAGRAVRRSAAPPLLAPRYLPTKGPTTIMVLNYFKEPDPPPVGAPQPIGQDETAKAVRLLMEEIDKIVYDTARREAAIRRRYADDDPAWHAQSQFTQFVFLTEPMYAACSAVVTYAQQYGFPELTEQTCISVINGVEEDEALRRLGVFNGAGEARIGAAMAEAQTLLARIVARLLNFNRAQNPQQYMSAQSKKQATNPMALRVGISALFALLVDGKRGFEDQDGSGYRHAMKRARDWHGPAAGSWR